MKRGSKKSPIQQPHIPKSEDELRREMEMERKRTLIKDEFYPALVAVTTSVEEATMLLGAISALIMAEAMETLHAKKMRDIKQKMVEKLTKEGDVSIVAMENLFEVFDQLTLFESRGHMESMRAVIDQMKMDEFGKRPLSSMEPQWEKYLN